MFNLLTAFVICSEIRINATRNQIVYLTRRKTVYGVNFVSNLCNANCIFCDKLIWCVLSQNKKNITKILTYDFFVAFVEIVYVYVHRNVRFWRSESKYVFCRILTRVLFRPTSFCGSYDFLLYKNTPKAVLHSIQAVEYIYSAWHSNSDVWMYL